jgi:DNA-binding transcriptional MerR regulator
LRYYEEVGLLRPVGRGGNGRRVYGWPDVSRLNFIRRSRDLGLSIAEIRNLLQVSDGKGDCSDARQVLLAHLVTVRQRRTELEALEASLQQMADRCADVCAGGSANACNIFEDFEPAAAAPTARPI